MKKHRFQTVGSNAIDQASTRSKDWGCIPVPGKGGNTTNADIPEWMFQRELNDLKGGEANA